MTHRTPIGPPHKPKWSADSNPRIHQERLPYQQHTARKKKDWSQLCPEKTPNLFAKILQTIGAFDDLNLIDKTDTLIGTFKVKRRTNKKGITSARATFTFKDDAVQ